MTPATPEDPDDLFQLVAQYGEDYSDLFANEHAAFEEFASRPSRDLRLGALVGLDQLLATASSEAELNRRLNAMAFNYVVTEGGSASNREFLLKLRGWLVESLRERPAPTS